MSARRSRSTGALPRKPSSTDEACRLASIARASSVPTGASAKAVSRSNSTKMPPRPTTTRGPNCGSILAPTIISRPRGTMGWTTRPAKPGRWAAAVASMMVAAVSTAAGSRRSSATRPASVLWAMSGCSPLSTTGNPRVVAAWGRFGGGVDEVIGDDGDAVEGDDAFGFALGQRGAGGGEVGAGLGGAVGGDARGRGGAVWRASGARRPGSRSSGPSSGTGRDAGRSRSRGRRGPPNHSGIQTMPTILPLSRAAAAKVGRRWVAES